METAQSRNDPESLAGSSEAARYSVTWLLRWITVRGAASALSGIVVLGFGGRLLMLASRLLHPDAIGRTTENGNRIGDFTVGGTIELILFGGLLSGLMAGSVWVALRRWIPDHPLAVGLAAAAIGAFNLVNPDNRDFFVLGEPALDIVMLVTLVFAFGVALAYADRLMERMMPAAENVGVAIIYTLMLGVGLLLAGPGFGQFTPLFCGCHTAPLWTGVFVWIAGLATVAWWVVQLRGVSKTPTNLEWLGRSSVVLAAVAGLIHLSLRIAEIL